MSPVKILAILLIAGGAAALAYGQFSYTQETHEAKLGPLDLAVKETRNVVIPQWMSAVAVGGGVLIFILDRR
ncbi:MAG TPA: hypothetical protein VGK20_08735 [Candidatus Binatia bacterium]|jgi:hypothetical protein